MVTHPNLVRKKWLPGPNLVRKKWLPVPNLVRKKWLPKLGPNLVRKKRLLKLLFELIYVLDHKILIFIDK